MPQSELYTKVLGIHSFCLNPQYCGGEQMWITTNFILNSDGEFYTEHEIILNSWSNTARIETSGVKITPSMLRQMADELELCENKIRKENGI